MPQYLSSSEKILVTWLTLDCKMKSNREEPYVSQIWELHAKGNFGTQSTHLMKLNLFAPQSDLNSFMEICSNPYSLHWLRQRDMTLKECKMSYMWPVLKDIETQLSMVSLSMSSPLADMVSENLKGITSGTTIRLAISRSCPSYVYAGHKANPDGVHPTIGAFLVIDKQSGELCLDTYDLTSLVTGKEEEAEHLKNMVSGDTPERAFKPVKDGGSGNMKLPVNCSYCDFKAKCWPEMRTFLYSNGPRFLTTVARTPKRTRG
jgi:hypothetical protein